MVLSQGNTKVIKYEVRSERARRNGVAQGEEEGTMRGELFDDW